MSPTAEEERVGSAIKAMLQEGELSRVPFSGAELRMKADRNRWRRIDPKFVVTVAAAVILIVVLFAAGPLRSSRHSPSVSDSKSGRSGALAHSAYGVQVSVPKNWQVQYFPGCPTYSNPGNFYIGTPASFPSCPMIPGQAPPHTAQVYLSSGNVLSSTGLHPPSIKTFHVNGLKVESQTISGGSGQSTMRWYIPSNNASLTGSGFGSLLVMQSLTRATPKAVVTPGNMTGNMYTEAIVQVPANGSITITNVHSREVLTSYAIGGLYAFSGAPAKYVVQGHDGTLPCPSVTVTVVSGANVIAPPIKCIGF
jgi:hypothetical protein